MKCCNTCPYLPENAGRETPPAAIEAGHLDWFSDDNLIRIWEGLREGEFLVCHSTLEEESLMIGKGVRPGTQKRGCIGAQLAAYFHFHTYEKLYLDNPRASPSEVYAKYREVAGDHPMTLEGIGRFAMKLRFHKSGRRTGVQLVTEFTPPRALRNPLEDPLIQAFNDRDDA